LLKLQFFNWSHYILCFKCCSWHWLLFTSPMIFSGSSILKGHEHLIWIIMNTICQGFVFWARCQGFVFQYVVAFSIFIVFMLLNSLIGCRYLETIFSRQHSDCPVEQFVQSINTINYLVRIWLWAIKFMYKWVVPVLISNDITYH
jgi:hypothetical protein